MTNVTGTPHSTYSQGVDDIELIGTQEAADLIGKSRETLIRRVHAGIIPAIGRLGRRQDFVFDRAVIDEYVRQGGA